MLLTPLLLLFDYPFPCLLELSKRRMQVIVLANIAVEYTAIMLCHVQRTVSHKLLKRERISSAVQKVLTSKSVAEFVNGGAVDSSAFVVAGDCVPQSIFSQYTSIHIAEKIIVRLPATDFHVVTQNISHETTKRNHLYFTVFILAKNDLHGIEIHIPILDVADG